MKQRVTGRRPLTARMPILDHFQSEKALSSFRHFPQPTRNHRFGPMRRLMSAVTVPQCTTLALSKRYVTFPTNTGLSSFGTRFTTLMLIY